MNILNTKTSLFQAIAFGTVSFLALGMAVQADELSLAGKRIGIAVVGTQHFWDREAFNGAVSKVEELGGEVVPVDGGRDNQVHADNHDILLTSGVDAVISILGDDSVEPKFEALKNAGIPVFTVDHPSPFSINNATSDNYYMGTTIGRYLADAIHGKGKVAMFNAFEGALRICTIRAQMAKYVLNDYPGIEIVQPELAEEFANAPEDARKQTLDLLSQYPEGTLDAIHVACWDQPAIGVVQALEEAGRTEVKVTALDANPETLEIMSEDGSPFAANVAQQPRLIGEISAQNVARHFAGEELMSQTYVEVRPVFGPEEAKLAIEELGYSDY
ncbi:MAG: sugar ABC transporter substrate-binding protein [Alphaproteobacteria bacterium]|nr:sugar ABC transporter substrate-binding protein [Alphaproteobacteria bacterium]